MPGGINFDGVSFAEHVVDPIANPRDRGPIFYHFPGYLDQRARPCEVVLKRVNGEDYKLIYTYDLAYTGNPSSNEDVEEGLDPLADHWELYKYSSDISETDDLLDGSLSNWLLYGGIATEMADDLSVWLNQDSADWNAKKLTVRAGGMQQAFPTSATLPVQSGNFGVISADIDSENQTVTISFFGEVGFLYDLQASNDLENWNNIVTNLPGSAPITTASGIPDGGIGGDRQRYYRIVLHD